MSVRELNDLKNTHYIKVKVFKILFRILSMILILTFVTAVTVACRGEANKYHAELYRLKYADMTAEFAESNRTYGTYYEDADGETIKDTDSPRTRTHIISNEDEFAAVFINFPADVDLEKQMIVMYMSTVSNNRACRLKKLTLDNGNLEITFKVQPVKPGIKDTTMPGTRFIAVVMDKADVDSVEFIQE